MVGFAASPLYQPPRSSFPSFTNPNPDFFHMGGVGNMEHAMDDDNEWDAFSSAESVLDALSSTNETRHYSNHMEGIELVLDKFTFEDMINFHDGAEVEILYVVYWDQGGNPRLGDAIQDGFDTRLKYIAEGKKAASESCKLKLNASYGRLLLKPIKTKQEFVEGKDAVHRRLAQFSGTSLHAHFIREDLAVVERKKHVHQSYNSSPSAAAILSMSKRPMNEVICLAEDLYDNGTFDRFGVFYTDTDSIHILHNQVDPLFKAYTTKYGRKALNTPGSSEETWYTVPKKTLGCFVSDFETKRKDHAPPLSTTFIGVGKKVYCDALVSYPKGAPWEGPAGEGRHESYHMRMKGVSSDAVRGTIGEEGLCERELYERLYRGYAFTFDLSKHMKTCFKSGKDFSVKTNTSFKRIVKISQLNIIIAHMEWVKSGHSFHSFPYTANGRAYFGENNWGEPYYKDWIRWEALAEAGKENLHTTCSSPGHLVTRDNLYTHYTTTPPGPLPTPPPAPSCFSNFRFDVPSPRSSLPSHLSALLPTAPVPVPSPPPIQPNAYRPLISNSHSEPDTVGIACDSRDTELTGEPLHMLPYDYDEDNMFDVLMEGGGGGLGGWGPGEPGEGGDLFLGSLDDFDILDGDDTHLLPPGEHW